MQYNSEAGRRLKAIIDTAIDGIITIDERGIVESINSAAALLFGYEQDEIIGQSINVLMPEPHRDKHDDYIKRYLNTKKPNIIGLGREVLGLRKDGSIFPMRLAVSEVKLKKGLIFTGIIHDLSNVKAAEEKVLKLNRKLEDKKEELENKVEERTEKLAKVVDQLLKVNKQLKNEIEERHAAELALRRSEKELKEALDAEKELSELKSRFVSMASHEFRTPLSTILSSIELIEAYTEQVHWKKRNKHIERIKNAVNYLTGVLDDFLSLSRLEEGNINFQPETFIFNDFFKNILEEIKLQLKPRQSLHHTGLKQTLEVFMDKNGLRHILFNLASNAIKYSDEGKKVTFITKVEQEKLHITIIDEGIGIPKEDQKYLFTRFFRAHNVENIKGTGLGLNIVKKYVDIMNGTINYKSKLGTGTSFTVIIPLNLTT